jgi:tetratricopeptide (TPR) repeat protein
MKSPIIYRCRRAFDIVISSLFVLVSLTSVAQAKGKVSVKKISRANVPQESQVSLPPVTALSLPPEPAFHPFQVKKGPSLSEADRQAETLLKSVKPANGIKNIAKAEKDSASIPPVPTLKEVTDPTLKDSQPQPIRFEALTPSQEKLVQGMIFLEMQKKYETALALFQELIQSGHEKVPATYQLALAAQKLGLHSEFRYQMLKILDEKDKTWQTHAAEQLAMNAVPGDTELVPLVDPVIEAQKIELENADQYQINRAKYYMAKKDLTKSFAAIDEISMESPKYDEALFLKSVILYRGGQLKESLGLAEKVVHDYLDKSSNDELKSIAALTLARMYFQLGKYKDAFNTYLKVDKQNPEWLQAMTEQAWAQILAHDYEGAAGNMFSLHTDFFKKAFNPESYVVRTVAYLNLCQFGDGAKVVYDFKRKYTPVYKMIEVYKNKTKNSSQYYDTIKSWAKNPDLKIVDGLPRQFIFALTRQPGFILEQKNINSTEDQESRMNQVMLDFIKTERSSLAGQTEVKKTQEDLKRQLASTKDAADKKAIQDKITYQQHRLESFKTQYEISKRARNALSSLRDQGLRRLEKEKSHFRLAAGKAVQSRFGEMMKTLYTSLDQSEVLQYELYSGAGEHLRYQMAGGKVNDKAHPELKAEDGKAMNWDFRGEIWEDEIGFYRSSLKNVCPPDEQAQLSKADTK